MRFTVVVPCYNAVRTLGPCLESIAEQTLPAAEVVVVDDGSTDDSREVARRSGLAVELLETPRRGGAAARNAGIAAATGTWIAFLDADDLWYPNHLARAAEVLESGRAVGYLNHYDRILSSGASPVRRSCVVDDLVWGSGFDDYIRWLGRYGHFVGMSSCMVERERAVAVGGLLEEQTRRHDIEFWLRVVADAPWVFDPVPTSIYRKGSPGGLSSDAAEAALGGLRALQRHRDRAGDRAAFDAILRERARSAIARAFESGDPETLRRAFEAAAADLAPRHRRVFAVARKFPGLFPVLRAARLT